jgi:hypothetical protein
MKKLVFSLIGVAVAIAIVAIINVNLNSQNSLSNMSVANLEALTYEYGEVCFNLLGHTDIWCNFINLFLYWVTTLYEKLNVHSMCEAIITMIIRRKNKIGTNALLWDIFARRTFVSQTIR